MGWQGRWKGRLGRHAIPSSLPATHKGFYARRSAHHLLKRGAGPPLAVYHCPREMERAQGKATPPLCALRPQHRERRRGGQGQEEGCCGRSGRREEEERGDEGGRGGGGGRVRGMEGR